MERAPAFVAAQPSRPNVHADALAVHREVFEQYLARAPALDLQRTAVRARNLLFRDLGVDVVVVLGVIDLQYAVPVLLPRESIPTIAEELANAIVPRDRGGKRRKVGETIEAYLRAKIDSTDPLVPRRNFTAVFAVEQILSYVAFTHSYQGHLSPETEALFTAINEIAPDVGRMLSTV